MFQIAKNLTSVEFEFFCPERHTYESVFKILEELYTEYVKELGEVPSIGIISRHLLALYQRALCERYILRQGKDEESLDEFESAFNNRDQVIYLWESGEFDTLDDFLEAYAERVNSMYGGMMFSINDKYFESFTNDLAKVLNVHGMRFHNLPDSYSYNLERMISPFWKNMKSNYFEVDFEINNPIMEVW